MSKEESMGEYEAAFDSDAGGELIDQASQIADEEAADMDALLAELRTAEEALGSAYNRLARATEPVLCVAQGRVETAQEAVEKTIDLIKGIFA